MIFATHMKKGREPIKIGHLIRMMRTISGKSQIKLAKEADISRSLLVALETDKAKNPRLDTLVSISRACGGTLADLFKWSHAVGNNQVKDPELWDQFRMIIEDGEYEADTIRAAIVTQFESVTKRLAKQNRVSPEEEVTRKRGSRE